MTSGFPGRDDSAPSITLRVPVIFMVLAATAIPIELRPFEQVALSVGFQTSDFLANVAGYVPVGIVLGGLGFVWAGIAAATLSTVAEAGQLIMVHRDPSVVDIAANLIGGIIGAFVSAHWKIQSPAFEITRRRARLAVLLAFTVIPAVWATSGDPLNPRGVTAPGGLEAYWRLDERGGRVARDFSARGLDGRFSRDAVPVAGIAGRGVKLDGRRDYIEVGHSSAFRLVGSMTISAWISSTSFPVDDAAIVSSLGSEDTGAGFQLDTTIDRGPRTIGFKVGNACGRLMARYGATPLVVGAWYHVAGVYDADARTIDVYLNGELDNGFLLGPVTGGQHSSRSDLYVGRRGDSGFEFAGAVGEVRIYSRALTKAEIAADMRGAVVEHEAARRAPEQGVGHVPRAGARDVETSGCAISSDHADIGIPIAAAGIGVLAAVACAGLWPSAGWLIGAAVSLAGGFLLLPGASPTLPALNVWLIPLTSLAGGAVVAVSIRPSPRTK
jgi:VanZ family protein